MSDKTNAFGAIGVSDIPDVPGFKVPPAGQYEVDASCEIKEINGAPNFIVNFEVTQPDGEGYLKGDKFGIMYSEAGLGYNKSVVSQILTAFDANNLAGTVEAGTVQALVTISHRKDKNDPEKVYCNLVKISKV